MSQKGKIFVNSLNIAASKSIRASIETLTSLRDAKLKLLMEACPIMLRIVEGAN